MNEVFAALLIIIIAPAIAALSIAMEERRNNPAPIPGAIFLKLKPARRAHVVRTLTQRH